jgi:hypothetical protein
MVLNILSEWYLAENQRFRILEFFNRIGQLPTIVIVAYDSPLLAEAVCKPKTRNPKWEMLSIFI